MKAILICLAAISLIAAYDFPSIFLDLPQSPFNERELWQDGYITISGAHPLESSVRVRGRGNSTWWDGADKRPLRLRLPDDMPVLGSDNAAVDWILLANHFDRSLLRNYAALRLGNMLDGLSFTPRPYFAHLYVNDEYMGLYLLTDERDVSPGRLELSFHDDPAQSGFSLELDARAVNSGVVNEDFFTVAGMHYDMRFPSGTAHMAYARDYIEAVSNAIRGGDFYEVAALIDIPSFIDFYIVQELFKNADAHFLSVFMYISGVGDNRRLYMSPLWDFDIAAANFLNQELGYGPQGLYVGVMNYWYRYLLNMPQFFDAVRDRLVEISQNQAPALFAHLSNIKTTHINDFERNFERHDIMHVDAFGSPAHILALGSFTEHYEFLVSWLSARLDWLLEYFNNPVADPFATVIEFYQTNPLSLFINGIEQQTSSPMMLIQYRVMMSLDDVSNIFDLKTVFIPQTGGFAIFNDDFTIIHALGGRYIAIDGINHAIDMPAPMLVQRQVYFPLYLLFEPLGLTWEFNGRTLDLRDNS